MRRSEYEYYYDDIYPSMLKRRPSLIKRVLLRSVYWFFMITARHTPLSRIRLTLYISLIAVISTGTGHVYALTPAIPAKDQSAIIKIKNEQTEAGSIVSEHVNEMGNGFTTVKMLEIPEAQLSETIGQWRRLGHEVDEDTIHNEEFIKYLINNTDIRLISYTAKVPMLYFLVKNEIAEPILYGGKIRKFFKTISFPGWFRIAGALDTQGGYNKGYEYLGTQKEMILDFFKGVLSQTVKGSYTIVEIYTDEDQERKGRLRFYKDYEQADPTFVQPIGAMSAFVLTFLNLVHENPGDNDVKKDLTKPIVERLMTKA